MKAFHYLYAMNYSENFPPFPLLASKWLYRCVTLVKVNGVSNVSPICKNYSRPSSTYDVAFFNRRDSVFFSPLSRIQFVQEFFFPQKETIP